MFSYRTFDLFDETSNLQEQEGKLAEKRKLAIIEILSLGGLQAVMEFAKKVESARDVGLALGLIEHSGADEFILPTLLVSAEKKITEFAYAYVPARLCKNGLTWADDIDYSLWTPDQIGSFLACFAFSSDTWKRVSKLLAADESPYWHRVLPFPLHYSAKDKLPYAIRCLIKYKRPNAAIKCIEAAKLRKRSIESKLTIRALYASLKSLQSEDPLDAYCITEMIKGIQEDKSVKIDEIHLLEWAFLPLLLHGSAVWPKLLEYKLASDAAFFCEFLRMAYKSNKAHPGGKRTFYGKN